MIGRRRIWKGVPLGFKPGLLRGTALCNPGPDPTLVLGEPGSGKTTDITCNFLLDEPGEQSFIVLDSKNTVRAITFDWRVMVCGADNVKSVNPENLLGLGSDGFNPIKINLTLPDGSPSPDYEDQALVRARALVPDTNEKQPHFCLRVRSLVAASIIDENRQAAKDNYREPDFGRIRLMWLAPPKEIAATLKRMMESGDPAITTRVSGYLSETDETDSVKATLEAVTAWATASMRADMIKKGGVDFAACRKRPTTIYSSLSTKSLIDKGPYFRVVVEAATDILMSTPGIKTTLIIEEGFALGRLDVLERLYAVAREHLIEIVIVFQRLPQIKQLYPHSWEQFVSGAIVAYRPGEPETARFLSERAGSEWRLVYSEPEPNRSDLRGRGRGQPQLLPRILPGEMYEMPKGAAIVFLPGDDAPRIVAMRGYFHKKLRRLGQRAQPNPYYIPPSKKVRRNGWAVAVILAGMLGGDTFRTHAAPPSGAAAPAAVMVQQDLVDQETRGGTAVLGSLTPMTSLQQNKHHRKMRRARHAPASTLGGKHG